MKILILMTGTYPPKEGIGSYVLNLAQRLSSDNVNQVTILTRIKKKTKRFELINNNIRVIGVPTIKVPVLSLLHFKFKIIREFKHQNFDIVHYNSPLMLFVKELKTKKSLVTIHSTMKASVRFLEPLNLGTILKMVMGTIISPIIEKTLLKNCNSIISVSDITINELVKLYNFKNKIHYVPNCINHEIFYPLELKRKNQFCSVGRLDYGKGVVEIIKALNKIQDRLRSEKFKFYFIGDGPLKNMLLKKITDYGIGDIVNIKEHLSQIELSKFLSQSYFSLINSKYETGPRTALESMAVSTPVISTSVGLLKSTDNKKLFIEINKNKLSIEKAMVKGLEIIDTPYYEELKQNSLVFSRKFYCKNLKTSIEKVYETNSC